MKKFTREEIFALIVIFGLLLVISVPNFVLSLRRARDQVRRDDLSFVQNMLFAYHSDFNSYPLSTPDGKLLACLAPGDSAKLDKNGRVVANLVPCQWGKDAFIDITPGSSKVYAKTLPGDPYLSRGRSYKYVSDGTYYQIFESFEGQDEPEYDTKIIARNLTCGNTTCNVGRFIGCDVYKTMEQCELEALNKK